MNVLFLNPPFKEGFSRASRSPAVAKGGTLYYPIWLAYAAGCVEQAGHRVLLLDAPARRWEMAEVLERLADSPPDLAVVETSTPTIYNDGRQAETIKARFPGCFCLLVGTHPSAVPEETLQAHPGVDGVAVGEYDHTVVELAERLAAGEAAEAVAGLVVRASQGLLRTPPREKIADLDALPFVSQVYQRHLDPADYFFAAANYPLVQIITGRGCPYRCFFCVYPQVFHSHRYRTRSAKNVVDEMAWIRDNLPQVREIGIEDDCFTGSYRHVREICAEILRRRLKVTWYCNVRGDVKGELLALMKQAGCRLVTVGFESANQEILDRMKKGVRLKNYLAFVADAKAAGLMVHGCLMVGNPGDTRQTLAESYAFAEAANFDSMQFYPLFVYPGTAAYDWAVAQGYLKAKSYREWLTEEGLHNCVIATPEFSGAEMMALCDDYLKRYHLRPRYLLMKAWQGIRDPAEGYRTLKSARVFFAKLFGWGAG